ncbi:MAG: 50S ribosomal protein L18 [Sandaracinus sp.]|nr:50S ribosomal protein L18 [Sandaracinus sp.]
MDSNVTGRARRKRRIRKKVFGTGERPRLSVFRSAKHIYAQVIDDTTGKTIASSSTSAKGFAIDGDKTAEAKAIGVAIAKAAREAGVEKVVFDRNGYIYHGRVKALADGAREGGLNF